MKSKIFFLLIFLSVFANQQKINCCNRHSVKENPDSISGLGVLKTGEVAADSLYAPKKFWPEEINSFVEKATHQSHTNNQKVMLGKYDGGAPTSYVVRAEKEGYAYFSFPREEWDSAYEMAGRNDGEMWRINEKFLDNQIEAQKEFYFSHDPRTQTGFLFKEWTLLKQKLNASDSDLHFIETENVWKLKRNF